MGRSKEDGKTIIKAKVVLVNYQIFFHPIAEIEYQEAYLWFEEQQLGLGDRFESAVDGRLNQILTKPFRYPKKRGVFRETKIATFPYLIVYKIYEKEKAIFVSAIYHASRDPRKKYRR